jgi:hypothetical protein
MNGTTEASFTIAASQAGKQKPDMAVAAGQSSVNVGDIKFAKPAGLTEDTHFIGLGSDAIAEQVARLDLRYVALNPGSSYRGIHDSIVNYSGNAAPEMITCLHEEHAVAVAHGYAKVTERPMAVALHANVGLMHASMAIYNAFAGRVPMLILGATGPLDDSRRRPWIDWIHTCTDQAALVRPMLKFDEQPHSISAATRALVRSYQAAASKPCAPCPYLCLSGCMSSGRQVRRFQTGIPGPQTSAACSGPGPRARQCQPDCPSSGRVKTSPLSPRPGEQVRNLMEPADRACGGCRCSSPHRSKARISFPYQPPSPPCSSRCFHPSSQCGAYPSC